MNIFKKIFGSLAGQAPGLIFIVEDNPAYAKTLESFLKVNLPENTRIQIFPVGETCIPELHRNPDLIIMDYMLDTKYYDAETGTEIVKEMRNQKSEVNIILLSSHDEIGPIKEAVDKFNCIYIKKDERAFEKIKNIIVAINS